MTSFHVQLLEAFQQRKTVNISSCLVSFRALDRDLLYTQPHAPPTRTSRRGIVQVDSTSVMVYRQSM